MLCLIVTASAASHYAQSTIGQEFLMLHIPHSDTLLLGLSYTHSWKAARQGKGPKQLYILADQTPSLSFTHYQQQVLPSLPWNSAPPALDSVVQHWELETLKELQLKKCHIIYPILYFHIQLLSAIIHYKITIYSGLRHYIKPFRILTRCTFGHSDCLAWESDLFSLQKTNTLFIQVFTHHRNPKKKAL